MVMLITAVGGIIVNIVMYKVLHNGDSHSHGLLSEGCSHDHGEHDHAHGHGHEHEGSSNKDGKLLRETKSIAENQLNMTKTNCIEDICRDDDCNVSIQAIHCHKN